MVKYITLMSILGIALLLSANAYADVVPGCNIVTPPAKPVLNPDGTCTATSCVPWRTEHSVTVTNIPQNATVIISGTCVGITYSVPINATTYFGVTAGQITYFPADLTGNVSLFLYKNMQVTATTIVTAQVTGQGCTTMTKEVNKNTYVLDQAPTGGGGD
jgi:hypothetical protein